MSQLVSPAEPSPALPGDAAADQWHVSPSRTRRVLHLVNGEHYAGAERVQDLLALSLPGQGYQVEFATLLPGRFAAARRSQEVPLHAFTMRGKLDLRPAMHVARLLKAGGFCCLHTHTPRSVMVGRFAASLAGVPLVHHLHGQTATEVRGAWKTRLYARLEKRSFAKAAKVIAVSETSRQYLLRLNVPAAQITVVANGVPSPALLAPRAVPAEPWTLGTVGLFRPRKGLETLLAALSMIKDRGGRLRWRGIGPFETPEYEAEVRALVDRLELGDVVRFPGFCHDVPAALAELDLFVFPSILAEGMPMVVLEALGAGVPVLASRVDGVTDILRHDETGWLVPPGDPAALADTLDALVRGQLDWQRVRQQAHALQRQQYSDASMAAGVAAIYDQILQ